MSNHHNSHTGRDSHKRSRSPYRSERSNSDVKRHRSRSPHRHRHRHHQESAKANLPFGSQHLHKRDFEDYRTLFAEYLDLQKQLNIEELDVDEVKGRWKSFLGKWNRGELAEGWYDPETKRRADSRSSDAAQNQASRRPTEAARVVQQRVNDGSEDEEEDDDGYGPALPDNNTSKKSGPSVPNLQDLQQKRELAEEDREARIADLRYDRKQDRKAQKERLEELVPRAEPGSRERQIEKKRDTAASNRAFAETKEAGADEVADGDLMGDDGGDSYRAKMRAQEKQKNEREIKKEEVLRARAAEREERMAEHRRKEAKTMDMLKQLAQQRFGGGN